MKLNSCVLLATLLLMPTATRPMAAALKQGLYKVCRSINIGLPLLPVAAIPAILAYHVYNNGENSLDGHMPKPENMPDAPPIIQAFVHENLHEIGFDKADLHIKMGPRDAASPYNKVISLDKHRLDSDRSLLQRRQSLSAKETEQLNLLRSIIQHEGSHLKNYEKEKRNASTVGLIGLVASNYVPLYSLYRKYVLKMPAPRPSHAILRSLALIPTGFAKFITPVLANAAVSRHNEQQADNGISDNVNILQAAANRYRKSAQSEESDLQSKTTSKRIAHCVSELLDSHPSDAQRAKRFEQRIAAIKKEQTDKK